MDYLLTGVLLVFQAEGANAADEEASDKSVSEVNDEDEGDEDGSGEVCLHSPFEFSLMILYGVWLVFIVCVLLVLQEDDDEQEIGVKGQRQSPRLSKNILSIHV